MIRRRCFGRGSEAAGGFVPEGCAPDSARADVVPDSLAPRRGVRAGRLRVAGAGLDVVALDSVEFAALFVEVGGWPDVFAPDEFTLELSASPVEFFDSPVSDFDAPV